MKKFFLTTVCMLAICFTMFLTACGGSDDDNNAQGGGGSDTTATIVGQWRMEFGQNSYVIITLNQDGSGRYYEYDHNTVEHDSSFNYTYVDGWLVIKEGNPVKVTDLSSTIMIIKDFPDSGSNIFKRIK